jgi:hypothetical protein
MVTHHGLAQSGPAALVHGVRPRVAVMQNGTRKGGAVQAFEIMRSSPGLEDIWQLHWSYAAGIEHNSPGVFIANVDDAETIANVLTTPAGAGRGGPGGGGGGRGQGGQAPGAGQPPAAAPGSAPGPGAATPPPSGATPPGVAPSQPALPAPSGQPAPGAAAPGQGGGGGRGAAAAAAAHSPAYYIKISVQPDGTFTVTNTRNGFSKTYVKRMS